MSTLLSRHVLDVLQYTLELRERITSANPPLLETEQARLRQMLLGDGEVRGHPEYTDFAPRPVPWNHAEFLGIRYALTCWVDEVFISDPQSPWSQQWKERALESELYGGSQERADRFWMQAELAEKRASTEAIEAFLWCIMLGFRGNPRMKVNELTDRFRRRVLDRPREFRLPGDLGIRTNVPFLSGPSRYRTAARLLIIMLTLLIFVLTTLVVQSLTSNP
ncbi:MAG: DotU family type IV/VI secretion system protein [Gemmataceae bacterium]